MSRSASSSSSARASPEGGTLRLLFSHCSGDLRSRPGHEDLDPLRECGVIAGAFDGGAYLARHGAETRTVDGQEIVLPRLMSPLVSPLVLQTLHDILGIHEKFLVLGGARRLLEKYFPVF